MNSLRKIVFVFLIIFPISNTFGAMVTFNQRTAVADGGTVIAGIHFNTDGTKMFTIYSGNSKHLYEYNLATPFDVSTKSYAGDSERCELDTAGTGATNSLKFDLEFSRDGMKLFFAEGKNDPGIDIDKVFKFDLTKPYDISTCEYANNATLNIESGNDLQNGSNAGDRTDSNGGRSDNRLQGFEINDDGSKLFLVYHGAGSEKPRLLEYALSTPFDLTTISLDLDAGIPLDGQGVSNPMGMRFSSNGKRLWINSHTDGQQRVTQISLDVAYSTSSFTIDGSVFTRDLNGSNSFKQPRGIALSGSGTKLYIGTDRTNTGDSDDHVSELDLVCPFNIITGKCPSIISDPDRAGIAEAQIETAKRAINLSTNSALNRLKWIRRNKDKENLTNQNAKLNFSGTMLTTLSPLPISSFKKISNHKLNKEDNKNYFHWSEGDISLGRIGETSTASRKENLTNSITYGVDRFKDDNGVEGFAIRYGLDDIDVGNVGSNLDSRTYNLTYYNTSPMKNDTKYVDKIFGIGRIESDILTKLDGSNVTADRTGHQIYGTLKIKDEYKKNNLTFIPSGQIDLGHTKLDGYQEVGSGAIRVQDHHITTQNLRAAFALVDDLSTDKYTFKRHGKLEYLADTDRSSSFKYNYVSDSSSVLIDNLKTGALHNLNFEIGIDIIFPERFSLFAIYERNQTLDNGYSGHTDNLYLAIGYLPNKNNEYTFLLNGSENLVSNFEIKKNINGYNISFNLAENLMKLGEASDASININKVF